jgi:acyl carrier protein
MSLDEFVKLFADLFDETNPLDITPETYFRELEEWSSLTGLAVMNVITKKCNVKISPEELKSCEMVDDIFKLVQSKL